MNDWSLYLDDIRNPKTDRNWKIARNAQEAKDLIETHGCPEYISFDHDLEADGPTGHDFAKWFCEQDMDGKIEIPDGFDFNVHSGNPVGATNIYYYMKGYLQSESD